MTAASKPQRKTPLLVVEDDPLEARLLVRSLDRYRPTELMTSKADALRALEQDRIWCGAILDLGLPDGSGLEVLDPLRRKHPYMPALVLTAHNDREYVNTVHALRAEFVCKPAGKANLEPFVQRALAYDYDVDQQLDAVIAELVAQHDLTPAERQVLVLGVSGRTRDQIMETLDIKPNTLKTLTRRMLKKTNDRGLEALSNRVLRTALHREPS